MFGRLKELHKLHLELLMELQHVVDNMQARADLLLTEWTAMRRCGLRPAGSELRFPVLLWLC
eukprot:756803-Rhodomonas_salina.2